MKVAELKAFLKKHGQPQIGIKSKLLRRAKGTALLVQQRAVDATSKRKREAQTVRFYVSFRAVDDKMIFGLHMGRRHLQDYPL